MLAALVDMQRVLHAAYTLPISQSGAPDGSLANNKVEKEQRAKFRSGQVADFN